MTTLLIINLVLTSVTLILLIGIAGAMVKMVRSLSLPEKEENLMDVSPRYMSYDQVQLLGGGNYDGLRPLPPNFDGVGKAIDR